MSQTVQIIVTIVGSLLASTGLWTFINARFNKRDDQTKMLIGLAHDRITSLGMAYIERGSITRDEYENLHDYLYVPYKKLGGNGSAQRIMEEVDRLPLR